MKIALIGNEYKQQFPLIGYGGIESCVENLALGLHEAGHAFYVVVPKRKRPRWGRLPTYPFPVIEVDFEPSQRSGLKPENFMAQVRSVIEAQKPEIIWAQSEWAAAPLLDLGIPIISTLHGSATIREPWHILHHPLCYYRFISHHQYQLQVVDEWEKEHCFMVYTGLIESEYSLGRGEGGYYLWVAGLNWGWEQKGLDIFVELARRSSDKKFRCYGSGNLELENKLKRLTRELKNFTFGGELKRGRDHLRAFQQARMFLMLTRTNEAFGRTIIESLSKGTPVLGRKTGAVPELIGSHGFCSNELEEIEQAMDRTFSREAAYTYSQQFSVKHEVRALVEHSQNILTKNRLS